MLHGRYVVRTYVLGGSNLASMDAPSAAAALMGVGANEAQSDPYLKVGMGSAKNSLAQCQ